jgi:hypothetical protein
MRPMLDWYVALGDVANPELPDGAPKDTGTQIPEGSWNVEYSVPSEPVVNTNTSP